MKTLFTFIFLLFFSHFIPLHAAHIVGGYMTYECLGGDDYRFQLVLYRDCFGGGAPFDSAPGAPFPGTVTVYVGDSQIPLTIIDIEPPVITDIPFDGSTGNCANAVPPNLCLTKGVYTFDFTLPATSEPVHVVYQRCCRAGNISNIVDPGIEGMTMSQTIAPEARGVCNSSPKFLHHPMACSVIDAGLLYHFHNLTDVEGDSLVYSFCSPNSGGGNNTQNATAPDGVAPNPDLPPPFNDLVFVPSISSPEQPIPGSPHFQINAESGVITGQGSILGSFVYGICVEEFRNGQLLSTTRFEAVHNVTGTPLTTNIVDRSERLIVYPSPAKGEAMIELPQINRPYSISIFDMNGRTWKTINDFSGGQIQLDVAGLPKGMYGIKAMDGSQQYFAKLVVQ